MQTVETHTMRNSISAASALAVRQQRVGSRSSFPAQSEQAALAEWYVQGLRPKLSRAVRAGRVHLGQVAGLERLMTDLLSLPRAADAADRVPQPSGSPERSGGAGAVTFLR